MKPGAFSANVMKISSRDKYSKGEAIAVTGGVFQTGDLRRFEVAAFHLTRQ